MSDEREPIIRLVNLRKEFDGLVAVDDLNLDIFEGEFLCFLGPSGCGKTTTLRMISGLETPTDGEIHLRGRQITHIPPQKRNVGFMFQNYALFWHMSVYDNIAFGLRVRGESKEVIAQTVQRISSNLELEGLLDVRASRLDLSAMQRVAMARVMAIDPDVLLLDEPLNNFRPGLRETMRGELKRWQKQLGRTMVYVTHDQEEAMTLGDRILIMNQGRYEQLDTPRRIYHHPANLFVAGFIGRPPMNFLEVDYVVEGEKGFFVRQDFRMDVTHLRREIESAHLEDGLILGIRPNAVLMHHPGEETPARISPISVSIDLVQPLGRKKILDLRANGDLIKMVIPGTYQVSQGESIQVVFDSSRVHIFDRQTKKVLG